MTHSILPSLNSLPQPVPSNSHVHPVFQQLLDNLVSPEIRHVDYLMLDLSDTVLQVRRMSASEARDTNLELEVEEVPYRWVPLSGMGD